MIDPANPVLGVNPMDSFSGPMDPARQQELMRLLMLLGGLGPQVPAQPQPQAMQMPPLLGGPVG